MAKRLRVGYLGGSFDPPHAGHLAIARAALASGRVDRVAMAPAWEPPHKQGARREAFAERLELVKLLIAGAAPDAGADDAIFAEDFEGRLRLEPSYTVEVLARYAQAHPDWDLVLVIGGDSLTQLPLWHRARALLERYGVLIFPRKGWTPDWAALERAFGDKIVQGLRCGVLDGPFCEISSTFLRKKLENSEKEIISIEEAVFKRIRERGLYQQGGKGNMTEKINAETLAKFCAEAVGEKLAEDIRILQLGPESGIADFLVVGSANSEPHLQAVANFVEREVRDKFHLRPRGLNGESASGWVLIDFNDVIVHVMTAEMRTRYNLEGLWGTPDAERKLGELAGR